MTETKIKDALIRFNAGIKRADGAAVSAALNDVETLCAAHRHELHPQLVHFLEGRSYAKAFAWLGGGGSAGDSGFARPASPPGRVRPPDMNAASRIGGRSHPDNDVSTSGKISSDGGQSLGQNPFGALSAAGLPAAPQPVAGKSAPAKLPARNRGRVDILRSTGGRGGKTVTLVTGFTGIGLSEKEQLAKKIRTACGCGGTVKDGQIEIQGDQRETVARILTEAGFRPVFAGG